MINALIKPALFVFLSRGNRFTTMSFGIITRLERLMK